MENSLKEFIRQTIEEINSGLPENYVVDDAIEFEVSVSTTKTKSGGLEIKILTGEISNSNEFVQKVSFAVINEKHRSQSDKKNASNIIKYIGRGIKELNKHSMADQQPKLPGQ